MITEDKRKTKIRAHRKYAPMTPEEKLAIMQKILHDQKIIREAIQSGVSFEELREKHGFKFATVPLVKD